MNYFEIGANIFYVVSTLYASRNSAHTWSTGIVSCLLFVITFFQVKLYADVNLQFFYIATCLYGWINWHKTAGKMTETPITRVKIQHFILFLLGAIITTGLYGFALIKMTDAANPFIDSLILALSVLGQFLLMKRKIENWFVWFVTDAIAIPLYLSKGLYLTALLYCGLLVIAIYGYNYWRKELKRQQSFIL